MVSDLNKQKTTPVLQADIKYGLTYESMSALGQKLYEIAREIEFSDEPRFDEGAIERELRDRRGGYGYFTGNQ